MSRKHACAHQGLSLVEHGRRHLQVWQHTHTCHPRRLFRCSLSQSSAESRAGCLGGLEQWPGLLQQQCDVHIFCLCLDPWVATAQWSGRWQDLFECHWFQFRAEQRAEVVSSLVHIRRYGRGSFSRVINSHTVLQPAARSRFISCAHFDKWI